LFHSFVELLGLFQNHVSQIAKSSETIQIIRMDSSKILGKIILCLFMLSFMKCSEATSQKKSPPLSEAFKAYWYSGKAELTRYKLEQARYGEVHEGDAVLIFVTEDFSTGQQVKFEGRNRDKNVQSILKLNFTRKFFTGLYPYSMMSSVFTPVDYTRPTWKVTTSSQEWCGHSYSQLNLRKNQYEGRLHSYFQEEGDQAFSLDAVLLEDEIWTKIRLNPDELPTGKIALIPGTQFLRLKHRPFAVERASATLETVQDTTVSSASLYKYRVEYEAFNRVLEITFEAAFPHAIVAWEEQTAGGLITRAVRTHSMNSPYWQQNNRADSVLRKELGLKE
jgi:hypothetical protein